MTDQELYAIGMVFFQEEMLLDPHDQALYERTIEHTILFMARVFLLSNENCDLDTLPTRMVEILNSKPVGRHTVSDQSLCIAGSVYTVDTIRSLRLSTPSDWEHVHRLAGLFMANIVHYLEDAEVRHAVQRSKEILSSSPYYLTVKTEIEKPPSSLRCRVIHIKLPEPGALTN